MRRLLPKEPPDSYASRSDHGIEGITVELVGAMDPNEAAEVVSLFAETTFGLDPFTLGIFGIPEYWGMAEDAAAFRGVVPTSLEAIPVTFFIDGVSRATTHQLVRTRVGAGFGQFSQRANPMRNFNMRIPETFRRLVDPEIIKKYEESLPHLRRFEDALLDAGVPYQDARYVLPEGTQTSITATYNLLSLMGTIRRRVCNRMQWEINYVARRMADLTVQQYPWVGRALRSGCEKTGTCQTIDPMFPPSCLTAASGGTDFALDHRVLQDRDTDEYNFPRSANANLVHFFSIDEVRLAEELAIPDIVMAMSVADPTPIAVRDEDGIWRAN